MGAPSSGMQAGEQASAEALLGAFKTIKAAERRKHASVLNYWLSIRGDKEFPPLHDLIRWNCPTLDRTARCSS